MKSSCAIRQSSSMNFSFATRSTVTSPIIGPDHGPLAQWIEHAPSKRAMWVRFPHGLLKLLSIQVAERADLSAVMQIVLDHRPEDAPRRPLLAPVRQHLACEARGVERRRIAL